MPEPNSAWRIVPNFFAENQSNQHKEKGPHNHSDGHMGEGWMNWVGIAEFCKGLIYELNHLVAPVSRKSADFAGIGLTAFV